MENREQEGLETLTDVPSAANNYPSDEEDDTDNQHDVSSLPGVENIQTTDILMVGLDNAGKTLLLYFLKLGTIIDTRMTIGYNVETLEYNDKYYLIWDVGGLERIRNQRKFFTENKSFVIYMVDVSDPVRFDEAQKDLHDVMDDTNLTAVKLIVLANKMDLVPEFVAEDLAKHLKLESIKQKWTIHACSALKDGDKLYDIGKLLQK